MNDTSLRGKSAANELKGEATCFEYQGPTNTRKVHEVKPEYAELFWKAHFHSIVIIYAGIHRAGPQEK